MEFIDGENIYHAVRVTKEDLEDLKETCEWVRKNRGHKLAYHALQQQIHKQEVFKKNTNVAMYDQVKHSRNLVGVGKLQSAKDIHNRIKSLYDELNELRSSEAILLKAKGAQSTSYLLIHNQVLIAREQLDKALRTTYVKVNVREEN
ncbi:hypothetical protein CPT_Mater71 [Bacillus phage Mater]|uniref:Uncharacterized protein n=1 Tax=Bacillus phage Mater TaxID=1540090 RepID=A0A0A0RUI8_9CAUD|nr:hypothetical protein CPT_Mater71 [Bacillus phage Mater]AIW03228.1 hypothetical protein CPT_Mater71 [Bacillus phage Mater]